jgi:hypothetical protein
MGKNNNNLKQQTKMTLKRTQVVMLPTNNKADLQLWGKWLFYDKSQELSDREPKAIFQHLYFVSDEKVKDIDNETCMFKSSNGMITTLAGKDYGRVKTIGEYHKIIATTDSSLKEIIPRHNDFDSEYLYPKPSEDFLKVFCEQYGKGNQIKEVDVEYYFTHETGYDKPLCPKTNSKNEISIKKVKDTYTKKEVKSLIYKYIKDNNQGAIFDSDDKWIEENL